MSSEQGAGVGTAKDEYIKAERAALLARALGCDTAKAAAMADKLAGLNDADFRAHADYMAGQLAGYMKSTRRR
jgi:hypothetical protein